MRYAHLLLFEKKNYDTKKKVHFFQFLTDPFQFIKITLHWLHKLFSKNLLPRYLCAF